MRRFRGYCNSDSEWREGFYFSDGAHHQILTLLESVGLYASQVDVNSLGQFTGMKTKKGKDIFEGDILKSNFDGCNGVVKFEVNYGAWCTDDFCVSDGLNALVVGNFYENPELITGGK